MNTLTEFKVRLNNGQNPCSSIQYDRKNRSTVILYSSHYSISGYYRIKLLLLVYGFGALVFLLLPNHSPIFPLIKTCNCQKWCWLDWHQLRQFYQISLSSLWSSKQSIQRRPKKEKTWVAGMDSSGGVAVLSHHSCTSETTHLSIFPLHSPLSPGSLQRDNTLVIRGATERGEMEMQD